MAVNQSTPSGPPRGMNVLADGSMVSVAGTQATTPAAIPPVGTETHCSFSTMGFTERERRGMDYPGVRIRLPLVCREVPVSTIPAATPEAQPLRRIPTHNGMGHHPEK